MNNTLIHSGAAVIAIAIFGSTTGGDEPPVKWLVEYRGDQLPDAHVWTQLGSCRAEIAAGALRVADDSAEDCCAFRAPFEAGPE